METYTLDLTPDGYTLDLTSEGYTFDTTPDGYTLQGDWEEEGPSGELTAAELQQIAMVL